MSDDVLEQVARLAKEVFPNNRLMRLAFVEGYKAAALTASRLYSDEIEEALKPFALAADLADERMLKRYLNAGLPDDTTVAVALNITLGHLRAARAALKVQTGERHGQ